MHNWRRVTKKDRCPICGKDSWCLLTADGTAAMCMRVQSEKSVKLLGGEVGYIHRLTDAPQRPVYHKRPKEEPAYVNCDALMEKWSAATKDKWFRKLAGILGVSCMSLKQLGFAWADEYQAWAIPMRDGHGNTIGIRLRKMDGSKFAVRGTHAGIFVPFAEVTPTTIVCEGPTDTAAAITLGFFAIGRPSCSGGSDHIIATVKRLSIRRMVILCDNDDPGMNGALALSANLPIPNCLMVLPTKDIREYVRLGGERTLLDSLIEQQVWRQPDDYPSFIINEPKRLGVGGAEAAAQ